MRRYCTELQKPAQAVEQKHQRSERISTRLLKKKGLASCIMHVRLLLVQVDLVGFAQLSWTSLFPLQY